MKKILLSVIVLLFAQISFAQFGLLDNGDLEFVETLYIEIVELLHADVFWKDNLDWIIKLIEPIGIYIKTLPDEGFNRGSLSVDEHATHQQILSP